MKDGTQPVVFCVELLNGAFMPYKIFRFSTREEAQQKYDELEPVYHAAFVRKYAKVSF